MCVKYGGFHTTKDIDKLYIQFCKKILGVRIDTCNGFVYNEVGWFPKRTVRTLCIFRFCIK